MALALVLLTGAGRTTDQKITWLAGWLHQSHRVTAQSTLCSDCKSPLIPGLRSRPKSDTELLLIVTSWKLHAPPSSFFHCCGSRHLIGLEASILKACLHFPPTLQLAGEWLKQPGHAQERRRTGRRWEALRPHRAYTRLHSSPPISPLRHPTRMLLQPKTSEEQIALCHVFWHLDVVPSHSPDLWQTSIKDLS